MGRPSNAQDPANPLCGAPFLETLQNVIEDPEGFSDPHRDVRLRVIRASGLSRADGLFTGKSDPYAVVYWNDEKVGTTKVVQDSLEPEWGEDMPLRVFLEQRNGLMIQVRFR
jgi:hypothetical protein